MKKSIKKARAIAAKLLAELEDMTGNMPLLNQFGDLISDPEGRRDQLEEQIQEAYRNAVSLPSRTEAMRNLADALKTLATLERKGSRTGKRAA